MGYRREPISSGGTARLSDLRVSEWERYEAHRTCFELRLTEPAILIPSGFDANLQANLRARGVQACPDLLTVVVETDVPGHSVVVWLRWQTGGGVAFWPTIEEALAGYGVTTTGEWRLSRLVREGPGGTIRDGGTGTGTPTLWERLAEWLRNWFQFDPGRAADWIRWAGTVVMVVAVSHVAASYFKAQAQQARVEEELIARGMRL